MRRPVLRDSTGMEWFWVAGSECHGCGRRVTMTLRAFPLMRCVYCWDAGEMERALGRGLVETVRSMLTKGETRMPPGYGYGQKGINTGKQTGGNLGPYQPPGVKSSPVKPKAFKPAGVNINGGDGVVLSGNKSKGLSVPPMTVPGGPSINTGGKRRKAG